VNPHKVIVHITDRYKLDFRMDIFNFINRANFGFPSATSKRRVLARLLDTVTPGRRIQFSLKFIF